VLDAGGEERGRDDVFDGLVEKLGLKDILDLPLIVLSTNGQTRRARIARAVMKAPKVLLS